MARQERWLAAGSANTQSYTLHYADGRRSQLVSKNFFKLAGFDRLAQTRPIPACQLYGPAKQVPLKNSAGLQAVPALSAAKSFRALCQLRYSSSRH